MRKRVFPLTIGAAAVVVAMLVSPVQAQYFDTWVASNGDDSNNCSNRSTPCSSFNGAYNKTNAGGEIKCVDSGYYTSGLTITKSITINCGNAIGSVPASLITVTTSATDVVILRGLDLDGLGSSFGGTGVGIITFNGAGVLHVDKVKINNMRGTSGNGIWFAPNGPARLDVSDSFIADMGSGGTSPAGIVIRPVSGGSANVSVSRTDLKGNVNGIFVDGGGGGPNNLNVRDSLVTGSSNSGIIVATTGPAVTALIDRTTVNYSLNTGVAVSGAAAIIRLGNSTVSNNVTGVVTLNSATFRSYKNNQINANSFDGTPIAAEALN